MEGGGSALAGGGHVLGAAQETRGQQRPEEKEVRKEAGADPERRGGMKFRVHARAPHGVGALLLIGGAAVVGAAVLAWRGSRRGKKRGTAEEDPRDPRLTAKEERLDGGIVEDEKVQCASLVQKLDQSDDNLSARNTDVGSVTLDGNVSEESHLVHKDNEITADQLDSKPEAKIDEDSDNISIEVHTHDLGKEDVQEIDQKSSSNHVEITAHDMCQDNEHVEEIDHVEGLDQNSSRNPVEIIMQEMVPVFVVTASVEKAEDDSIKNDIEKEIAQKDNKDEISDQSRLSINGPGIILSKHNDESDGIQEAESMENTPTAQLMMHQDQLLDDMVMDTVTEAEEAKHDKLLEDMVMGTVAEAEEAKHDELLEDMVMGTVIETEEAKHDERTITDESELEQDEKKALAGLVELVSSPALPSLVKPIEKKEPEFATPNETGMKVDYTNGELREHGLISKGGAMPVEGDIATMDRRSSALAILALIFALTMGITIIVRLYAPPRAMKLQMDLP